jgi:hypothetical protein
LDRQERPVQTPEQVREKMLDKNLADSFPTSDPPSSIPDPAAFMKEDFTSGSIGYVVKSDAGRELLPLFERFRMNSLVPYRVAVLAATSCYPHAYPGRPGTTPHQKENRKPGPNPRFRFSELHSVMRSSLRIRSVAALLGRANYQSGVRKPGSPSPTLVWA